MTQKDAAGRERERAAVGMSRRGPAPAQPGAWNPFERVYTPGGTIDRDYAAKRLPVLVDLLRRHPSCFGVRIDVDRLSELLIASDATTLREASTQDDFENALRAFSEAHLHEIVPEATQQALGAALVELAKDESMTRRDRAGAALGVALLSVPPDAHGLRGRGIFDLVLRVTMEEQTAQENLRKRSRETDGGVPAEDLAKFWEQYPALRWQHEERYRREVSHVLRQIEADHVPPAISVDLAMRGASKLLAAVSEAKSAGRKIDAREAESILKAPFVEDMTDGGATVVVARWRAESFRPGEAPSDERRTMLRAIEIAARLVEEHGPGGDAVLFYLYMRAVVQGHYFVRDDAELQAATALFGPAGLVAAGALTYAEHLAARNESEARHRVLIAALELWPQDADVRAATEAMGRDEEEAARKARLGPTPAPPEEKVADADAKADADEPGPSASASDVPYIGPGEGGGIV